jgi:hypothetical protein
MARTFGCYITEDPRAKELKEKLNTWAYLHATLGLGFLELRKGAFCIINL